MWRVSLHRCSILWNLHATTIQDVPKPILIIPTHPFCQDKSLRSSGNIWSRKQPPRSARLPDPTSFLPQLSTELLRPTAAFCVRGPWTYLQLARIVDDELQKRLRKAGTMRLGLVG